MLLFRMVSRNELGFFWEYKYFVAEKEKLSWVKDDTVEILDADIEIIGEKNFSFEALEREALNGCGWPSDFWLDNVKANFRWIKNGEKYCRIYSFEADVLSLNIYQNEYLPQKLVCGNRIFVHDELHFASFCYNICTMLDEEGRSEERLAWDTREECLADMKSFDAKDYHFAEVLEDMLGDVG